MKTILFIDNADKYGVAEKQIFEAGMVVIKFPRKLYNIAKFRYGKFPEGKITNKTLDKYINEFINN